MRRRYSHESRNCNGGALMRPEQAEQAKTLRDAATILLLRSKRQTFALRVIIRVLERTASRIEAGP